MPIPPDISVQDQQPSASEPPVSTTDRSARQTRRFNQLQDWITAQVDLEHRSVLLPRSQERYEISLPTEASRLRLFEEAKRDPDMQMPHWANIWASGVALGDVALTRADEVAGRRVLELGCGLGVTAAAAIKAGATVVAADYSALPLAFCRYNSLVNSGNSPRTLAINWRYPSEQVMVRCKADGGFPIIMAADVLYESRDIRPLLNLVDQLLAVGGTFWLAEPGRRTALRFLNTAAELGWQGVSEYVEGPWPDGSTTRVGLHFLRRATYIDPLSSTLGGWRT